LKKLKKMTVVSGKGGTGKTSLVGSFAYLSSQKSVLVDGDVDAANLSLISRSEVLETHEFRASKVAVIDPEKCNQCGLCRELCRFEAVSDQFIVDPVACEGCRFCAYACAQEAINMQETLSGHWYISKTPHGMLVHARLGIAEENSGKLVAIVRNKGEEIAESTDKEHLIVDGSPGIGCPVIASLSGVDAAMIVTEPTVSGIHDLERILFVCQHFGVPAKVCINRFDLGQKQSEMIEEYCEKEEIPLVGKIPFDRAFVEAMVRGISVMEYNDGALARKVEEVWDNFLKA